MRMLCRNGARLFEIPLEVLSKHWHKAFFYLIIAAFWAADGLVSCTPLASSTNPLAISFASFIDNSSKQCLYLTKNQSMKLICAAQVSDRREKTRKFRLKFCSSYNIYNLISASDMASRLQGPIKECSGYLNRLVDLDEDIYQKYTRFEELLDRFDCTVEFSVHWTCSHCKRAYREWLCATHLSFHINQGNRTPPCDSFCTRIEQMCPFFRPRNIDTHVGDPGFLCKDKDIPTDPGSVYGSEPSCYKLCHLIKVNEEFGIDYDTTCHEIKNTLNKTKPYNYYWYATSSSRSKHSITLGELVHFLALVWTLRTILQISDIGLT